MTLGETNTAQTPTLGKSSSTVASSSKDSLLATQPVGFDGLQRIMQVVCGFATNAALKLSAVSVYPDAAVVSTVTGWALHILTISG